MHPAKARVEVNTSLFVGDKEYIAEAILDHFPKAPTPIRLQGSKVLVKWLGYEGEDTWEFIDGDIRRTPQFAEYAKNFSDLAKFIPRDTAPRDSGASGGGAGRNDSKRGCAARR